MRTTQQLAEYVCTMGFADIDPIVIERCKDLAISSVGSTILGASMSVPIQLADYVRAQQAPAEASVVGFNFRTSAEWAAAMNCTSSHATELEDVAWPEAQYTCFLIPTVFSLGEKLQAPGRALIEALIIGYEVAARPNTICTDGGGAERGWLTCSQQGTIGSAAAAAKMMGLSFEQTWGAISLAASFAGGLLRQTGSAAHVVEAGFAGRNGIMAAMLAKAGMAGNPTILEGRSGFWDALAGQSELEFDLGNGTDLRIMAAGMKKFPCCYLAQRIIDGLLDLKQDHQLDPNTVDSIIVEVNDIFPRVLKYPEPQDGEQARFSLPHIAASVLCGEPMDYRTFTTDKIGDPRLARLRKKVELQIHEDWGPAQLGGHNIVRIILKDGRVLTQVCEHARGDAEKPMSRDEVISRFFANTEALLPQEILGKTIEHLSNLESVNNLAPLMARLAAAH